MTKGKYDRKDNVLFVSLAIETILLVVATIMVFFNIKGYFAPALTSLFSMIGSLYYYFYICKFSYICIDDKNAIEDEYLEKYVEGIFRKKGYKLQDYYYNGITNDIVMYKKKNKIIINIYGTKEKIDFNTIQNLVISMWNFNADKGYLIANSKFDNKIMNVNCSCDVELWDKDRLMNNL